MKKPLTRNVPASGSRDRPKSGTALDSLYSLIALALAACGGGGGGGGLDVTSPPPPPPNPPPPTPDPPPASTTYAGRVNKGPVQGGPVYMDSNNNGQYDPGEPRTVTNPNGYYSLSVRDGTPIGPVRAELRGATDRGDLNDPGDDRVITEDVELVAPAASVIISAFTTALYQCSRLAARNLGGRRRIPGAFQAAGMTTPAAIPGKPPLRSCVWGSRR